MPPLIRPPAPPDPKVSLYLRVPKSLVDLVSRYSAHLGRGCTSTYVWTQAVRAAIQADRTFTDTETDTVENAPEAAPAPPSPLNHRRRNNTDNSNAADPAA